MFYKQTPVKTTGNGLAAGCQVFYCKIYGLFYSVVLIERAPIVDIVGKRLPPKLAVRVRMRQKAEMLSVANGIP